MDKNRGLYRLDITTWHERGPSKSPVRWMASFPVPQLALIMGGYYCKKLLPFVVTGGRKIKNKFGPLNPSDWKIFFVKKTHRKKNKKAISGQRETLFPKIPYPSKKSWTKTFSFLSPILYPLREVNKNTPLAVIFPTVLLFAKAGWMVCVCIDCDWSGAGLACQVLWFPRIPHILVARAGIIIMTDECLSLLKEWKTRDYFISQF